MYPYPLSSVPYENNMSDDVITVKFIGFVNGWSRYRASIEGIDAEGFGVSGSAAVRSLTHAMSKLLIKS